MSNVLEISNLNKSFGDFSLKNVSFSLPQGYIMGFICLLYTSDAADDLLCVDLGGRRILKKQNT